MTILATGVRGSEASAATSSTTFRIDDSYTSPVQQEVVMAEALVKLERPTGCRSASVIQSVEAKEKASLILALIASFLSATSLDLLGSLSSKAALTRLWLGYCRIFTNQPW
jgi:hypothetical protein